MKKYVLSVLIIFVLVGFFSPTINLHAVAPDDFIGPPNPNTVGCILGTSGVKLQHLLSYATCIINKSVVPLLFSLAVALFVWGVVMYVINSSEEAKKEKGRQFMIWGIIALTVMVSVWGLVRVLGNTFGIQYVIPQVKSR